MRFIISLIIIGLVVFIVQQSHLIETKKVADPRIGVEVEQTHINWKNLSDYFENLKKDFNKSINRKKRYRDSF